MVHTEEYVKQKITVYLFHSFLGHSELNLLVFILSQLFKNNSHKLLQLLLW